MPDAGCGQNPRRLCSSRSPSPVDLRGSGISMQLDRIDRKILAAVQADCTIGADQLGALCGASPSTALRRLKKLRAAGVIVAEIAVLDGKKVGRGLLMIL